MVRKFSPVSLAIGSALLLQLGATAVNGASISWRSDTAGTAWATGSNWLGGAVPVNDLTTDFAVFNQTSYVGQPTAPAGRKIHGIVIGDGVTNTGALNITTQTLGNRLVVGSGGITMNANAGSARIGASGFNQGILLGADQTWTNNSSNTLTIRQISNANVTDSSTPYTVTFTGSGTAGITVESAISDGTSAVGLKVEGGLTTLGAANTFTGGMTMNSGTLVIGNANALGGSGNTVTINGGTLSWGGAMNLASNVSFVFGGNFTASGTGGDLTLNRPVLLTGNRTMTVPTGSSFVNIYGGISDGGNGFGFTKAGNVTVRLGGVNTHSGDTKVTAGLLNLWSNLALQNSTLDLAGGTFGINQNLATDPIIGGVKGYGTFNFNGAAPGTVTTTLKVAAGKTVDFTGSVTGLGSTSTILYKTGSGTQVFSGTGTYSGETRVNEGTLVINGNFSGATGAVTVAAGATLGGSGTIGGATTISGIHAPGNSPGIQTFSSNLTYSGSSSVIWELVGNTTTNAANPNAVFDSIVVGGDLTFTDPTTLTLSFNYAGSTVDWADSFWSTSKTGTNGWLLYSVTGSTTAFANLGIAGSNWADADGTLLGSINPDAFFTPYFDSASGDIYLNYVIPEPATSAMVLGGLGVLLFFQRSGRRRA